MRNVWVAAVALAGILMAREGSADTVYLINGQSFWGNEAYEEGDLVVVVRPGGDLTFPKAEVSRIERLRSTLPPFYIPPAAPSPEASAPPAGLPGPPAGTVGPAAPPASPGEASPPGPTGGAPPAPPPMTTGPTQLPPPPPPPPYGSPR